jgi:hypothetical protein
MLNHNSSTPQVPSDTTVSNAREVWPVSAPVTHDDPARTPELAENDASHLEAIDYILTDCFFSLGQGVKGEKTIEQSAIVWLHDRYRTSFLRTMRSFGNTWLRDRVRVKGVSRMLGERAAYYAGDKPTIDLGSVKQAAAAVEKYCRLHAARRFRSIDPRGHAVPVRRAGYWCEPSLDD